MPQEAKETQNDPLLEAVSKWVEKNRHNPTFKFVLGNRAYTADELLENLKKNTAEGREIRKMIDYAAADLILG